MATDIPSATCNKYFHESSKKIILLSDDKEHFDDFLFKSKEDAKAWLETQNYDEDVYLVTKDVYFEEFKTVE